MRGSVAGTIAKRPSTVPLNSLGNATHDGLGSERCVRSRAIAAVFASVAADVRERHANAVLVERALEVARG